MKVYNVLIVEDDPMVAMINEQYVNRNDRFHVVQKCSDGTQALKWLEDHSADLMILDVYMPVMNGTETLRRVREKNISISVIMVTAANDHATVEEFLRLGAVDYLVKPFAYDRFQLALQKFAAQSEALNGNAALNQTGIDRLFGKTAGVSEAVMPKGIQPKTLKKILEFINWSGGRALTGEEIADKVSLSVVTVRRYMSYLIEQGEVDGELNYDTGGRPSMLYTLCGSINKKV